MTEIISESRGAAPKREATDVLEEIRKLANLRGAVAVETTDRLLSEARQQQDENGPGLANLLHDLRDLFSAGQATPAEIADYVRWRLGKSAAALGLQTNPGGPRGRVARPSDEEIAVLAEEVDRRIAASSPALKPHWLYLRGAIAYKLENFGGEEFFERVTSEFPKHPRAEAAQFMIARCLLARSRHLFGENAAPGFSYASDAVTRAAAKAAFEKYVKAYPQGRFRGDALGWLGATAFDAQDYVSALAYYLEQGAIPDHPEFTRPAGEMCERILSHLASAPDEAAIERLAEMPAAALGLVYLIGNSTESDNFNGDVDEVSAVMAWRKEVLPRVAAAIAHHEDRYRDAVWRPRYLAMLALAASETGQHDEAAKLVDMASGSKDEDLLFARGITRQRARRSNDAIAAFESLLREYPSSSLAQGVRFRLALARFDNQDAGRGVAELSRVLNETANSEPVWPDGSTPILAPIDPGQFRQLMDAQLNFAPINELAAALDDERLDPGTGALIRGVLAQRLLAQEKFSEAQRYVAPAVWDTVIKPIALLHERAARAKGASEKAGAHLELANAWAAARGKILLAPLDTEENRSQLFSDEQALAAGRRSESAAALGVTGNYDLDMENRDELRHAFNEWLAASDAQPKSALAAEALLKAISAMPDIADVSVFHLKRAQERNWSEVSRKLYDRLLREAPKSSPARRAAVYWDFSVPDVTQEAPEEPPTFALAADAEQREADPDKVTAIIDQTNFRVIAPADLSARAVEIVALRARARRELPELENSRWVNFLDDLSEAIQTPHIDPECFNRYLGLRKKLLQTSIGAGSWEPLDAIDDEKLRREIADMAADPKMAPLKDFLAYLDLAVVANHLIEAELPGVEKDGAPFTWRTRDYPKLVELAVQFLAAHPKSRKREAALLILARSLAHGMEPAPLTLPIQWPVARTWEGGTAGIEQSQIPFDPKRLAVALDQHRREFPHGRYAAEIMNLRGRLAFRTHDWPVALSNTVPLLDDPDQFALASESAQRLGRIFDFIGDVRERPALIEAMKSRPRARERLLEYLDLPQTNGPIRYLKPWIRANFSPR